MTEDTSEALVWTSKGNLKIDDLEYFHFWEDTEDYTKFVDGYKLDGEVIKQSAHVMLKKGLDLGASFGSVQ